MSPAAVRVLDRLHNVKQLRPDNWAAGCPCCQSKRGRPISVRQIDDRVLVFPFCGCGTDAVVEALGLSLADLYDQPLGQQLEPVRNRIPARDVLELVSHEIDAACILLAEMIEGRGCSELAWERLAQAAHRVGRARDHVHGR